MGTRDRGQGEQRVTRSGAWLAAAGLLAGLSVPILAAGAGNGPDPAPPPLAQAAPLTRQALLRPTEIAFLAGLGVAAVAVGSLKNDAHQEAAFAGDLERSPLDSPLDVANVYGTGVPLALASAAMFTAGRLGGHARLAETGADLGRSLATAWAATWALKLAVHSRRPNGGRYSFPSGHTATAFAAAPVLMAHFGPEAGVPAYALASLTGLARIEERKHHAVDVLGGAAIGLLAGRLFSRDDGPYRLSVGASGVALTLRF